MTYQELSDAMGKLLDAGHEPSDIIDALAAAAAKKAKAAALAGGDGWWEKQTEKLTRCGNALSGM